MDLNWTLLCGQSSEQKKLESLIDKANCMDAWCMERAGSYILSETEGLLSLVITIAQMSQSA